MSIHSDADRIHSAGSSRPFDADQRGAVLPTVSLALVLLLGAAALVVDLGWIYLNGNRLQKAADAAALAGVVHVTNSMLDARVDAELASSLNGFPVGGDTVLALTATSDNDLEAALTTEVETFFFGVLGFDTIDVTKTATARYISNVKIGNPGNCFGVGTPASTVAGSPCPTSSNLWAAIYGGFGAKLNGDAYATRCIYYNYGCGGTNPEYRTTGYAYGIDVESGVSDLTIKIFDAPFLRRMNPSDGAGDAFGSYDRCCTGPEITYALYEPDSTPANPDDNTTPVAGCTATYLPDTMHSTYENLWTDLCTISGTVSPGVYVLKVTSENNKGGTNHYSLAAVAGSGPNPTLFGIDDISIFTNQAGAVASLSLAEIEEHHAGKKLQLRFFDPGEDDLEAWMRVRMPDGTIPDCTWVATNEGTVTESQTTAAPCTITTTEDPDGDGTWTSLFNGQWVSVTIEIPTSYTCGSDCWWEMEIQLSKPHDRTTWEVEVIGNPVRLIENS